MEDKRFWTLSQLNVVFHHILNPGTSLFMRRRFVKLFTGKSFTPNKLWIAIKIWLSEKNWLMIYDSIRLSYYKTSRRLTFFLFCILLTDTGENVKKLTRVFSTRRWVILVARMRRKKEKKIACPLLDVFAFGQVSSPRLYRSNLKSRSEKSRFSNSDSSSKGV